MSKLNAKYLFKQGRSFTPIVKFVPQKDGLQSLTGWTVTCQVRDAVGTRWDVGATVLPNGVEVQLDCPAETTAKWSIGIADIDIRYTLNGFYDSTDTLQFEVTEAITQK